MSDNNEEWRTEPLYTISESAHLSHISHQTVRNWLYGRKEKYKNTPPILGIHEKAPQVSFLQLTEILIAYSFRKNKIPLDRIRDAHDFAQEEWGVEFPFASLQLEPLGGHILHRFDEKQPGISLATLDTKLQQWTLPGLVLDTLRTFEYELELAARWFPKGKDIPIVVDPRINAGLPTVRNRRVTIETIRKRFKARYSIPFIASDLKMKKDEVVDVLRFADEVTV
ncbi:DUF433 domain-containing protein [Chloroflexota bacterium]